MSRPEREEQQTDEAEQLFRTDKHELRIYRIRTKDNGLRTEELLRIKKSCHEY